MGKGTFWKTLTNENIRKENLIEPREKKIASQFLHRVILIVFSMELIYNFVQALIKWIRTVATFFSPSFRGRRAICHAHFPHFPVRVVYSKLISSAKWFNLIYPRCRSRGRAKSDPTVYLVHYVRTGSSKYSRISEGEPNISYG